MPENRCNPKVPKRMMIKERNNATFPSGGRDSRSE